jgi:hypothetical protein
MKTAAWMIAASVGGWLAAAGVTADRQIGVALFAGMIGPLAMAAGSWLVAERTFRRTPEQLTGAMAALFVGKMVFVALYIAVAVRAMAVRPLPFAISFTIYFIALYSAEAFCLRRLFAGGADAAAGTLRS